MSDLGFKLLPRKIQYLWNNQLPSVARDMERLYTSLKSTTELLGEAVDEVESRYYNPEGMGVGGYKEWLEELKASLKQAEDTLEYIEEISL